MEACSPLNRRIAWCERMIEEATDNVGRYCYDAEKYGLQGMTLIVGGGLGSVKRKMMHAYELGLRDRATLMRLEGMDV